MKLLGTRVPIVKLVMLAVLIIGIVSITNTVKSYLDNPMLMLSNSRAVARHAQSKLDRTSAQYVDVAYGTTWGSWYRAGQEWSGFGKQTKNAVTDTIGFFKHILDI